MDNRYVPQRAWTDYRAFLLRLWREDPEGSWRASLQDAISKERYGFSDLGALFRFLSQQTGEGSPSQQTQAGESDRPEPEV